LTKELKIYIAEKIASLKSAAEKTEYPPSEA
jgi:hypothetical protein